MIVKIIQYLKSLFNPKAPVTLVKVPRRCKLESLMVKNHEKEKVDVHQAYIDLITSKNENLKQFAIAITYSPAFAGRSHNVFKRIQKVKSIGDI